MGYAASVAGAGGGRGCRCLGGGGGAVTAPGLLGRLGANVDVDGAKAGEEE